MSNASKKAILRALIEGVITDLMVKTKADNVYIDDNTTVSAKLSEIISSLNGKATAADVTREINTAISNLIDGAPEAYDTLKEVSDYIAEHGSVINSLNAAIGNKVDKSEFETVKNAVNALGSLASKSKVAKSDLESSLSDEITANTNNRHNHSNKSVLDGITATKIQGWDSKGTVYATTSEPSGLGSSDLWIQLVD